MLYTRRASNLYFVRGNLAYLVYFQLVWRQVVYLSENYWFQTGSIQTCLKFLFQPTCNLAKFQSCLKFLLQTGYFNEKNRIIGCFDRSIPSPDHQFTNSSCRNKIKRSKIIPILKKMKIINKI